MDSSKQLYSLIGSLVRTRREQLNFTQEELARRVGLTRTSISNIESGRQQIQIHTLYAIAEALQVSAHTLLPISTSHELDEIDQHLPNELLPEEREWVKRILTNEME